MTGGPNWINSDRYDIDAKLEDSQIAALEKLAPWDRSVQVKLMLQSLLADRFKLVVNDDTTAPARFTLWLSPRAAPNCKRQLGAALPLRVRSRCHPHPLRLPLRALPRRHSDRPLRPERAALYFVPAR